MSRQQVEQDPLVVQLHLLHVIPVLLRLDPQQKQRRPLTENDQNDLPESNPRWDRGCKCLIWSLEGDHTSWTDMHTAVLKIKHADFSWSTETHKTVNLKETRRILAALQREIEPYRNRMFPRNVKGKNKTFWRKWSFKQEVDRVNNNLLNQKLAKSFKAFAVITKWVFSPQILEDIFKKTGQWSNSEAGPNVRHNNN